MRHRSRFAFAALALGLALLAATPARAGDNPTTTIFRFQGQVSRNGQLLSGQCDFRFSLWDAASMGIQIGSPITVSNVNIVNGWVSRGLDFSPPGNLAAFNGQTRFLQIAVRSPAGVGAFTVLGRQEIKPVPYALHSLGPWATEGGSLRSTSGNVIIGDNKASAFRLDVDGDIRCISLQQTAASDSRLKRDIQPIEPGSSLRNLMALRGVTFEYTDEAIKNKHVQPGVRTGFIAQDVEKVIPSWVGLDNDGYRYISEQGTTALMVEALRDLRTEKDEQLAALSAEKDAQIAELADANEQLRQRLAALEAAVALLVDAKQAAPSTDKTTAAAQK